MRSSDWSSDVCSSDLADQLAQILGHVLRGVEFLPLARGDEQILPVGGEGEAVRKMAAPRHLGVLFPDDVETFEARRGALRELRLADDRAKAIAAARLDPAQLDGARRGEFGCLAQVAAAALSAIGYRGRPRDNEDRALGHRTRTRQTHIHYNAPSMT